MRLNPNSIFDTSVHANHKGYRGFRRNFTPHSTKPHDQIQSRAWLVPPIQLRNTDQIRDSNGTGKSNKSPKVQAGIDFILSGKLLVNPLPFQNGLFLDFPSNFPQHMQSKDLSSPQNIMISSEVKLIQSCSF